MATTTLQGFILMHRGGGNEKGRCNGPDGQMEQVVFYGPPKRTPPCKFNHPNVWVPFTMEVTPPPPVCGECKRPLPEEDK